MASKKTAAIVGALALVGTLGELAFVISRIETYYSKLYVRQPRNITIFVNKKPHPDRLPTEDVISQIFSAAQKVQPVESEFSNPIVVFPLEIKMRGKAACFGKTVLALEEARKLGIEAIPNEVEVVYEKVSIFHAFLTAKIGGKTYYIDPTLEFLKDDIKDFFRTFLIYVSLNEEVWNDGKPLRAEIYPYQKRKFPNIRDTITQKRRAFAGATVKPEIILDLQPLNIPFYKKAGEADSSSKKQ